MKNQEKNPSSHFQGNDCRMHPEPHLLRAVDWFDSQGIRRDIDKVYNFKHTLDGEAREWYADYARQADIIPPWNTLINDFSLILFLTR